MLLGQCGYFWKIYLRTLGKHIMKDFVRHGQCASIIFPGKFPFGSCKKLLDLPVANNRTLLTGPGIYPQILALHVLLVRVRLLRISQKKRLFFMAYNNQVLLLVISRCSRPSCTLHKKVFIYLNTHLIEELIDLFWKLSGCFLWPQTR